jgi:hypothetical protein
MLSGRIIFKFATVYHCDYYRVRAHDRDHDLDRDLNLS